MAKIDQLIINVPYEEPKEHWKYNDQQQTFEREKGRRPAGYFVATQGSKGYNDMGDFKPIPRINEIRRRVKAWKNAGYPGITGITRKLLEHWNDREQRPYPFFFCQMDAMETLIWLTEAREEEKTGITLEGDGGPFSRICTKLCTGGGKTTVMAMLMAWQICNKVSYPQDKRFSKNIFIVAPGLTVKNRLQVLMTGGEDNYYHEFRIVPMSLTEKLRQGKVVITNWQTLAWDTEADLAKKKTVDKRGVKSNEAYTRDVLGLIAQSHHIVVINDEAHHAWRINPENQGKLDREGKEAAKEATIWVSGLDRIHAARGILTCYDFSATPFVPSGKKNDEESLFSWIVSDFGLNDGIESGLVKTPRVVVRDDAIPNAKDFRSKLYHLYTDETVKSNVNRAEPPETPLPDLVIQAYNLLGADWRTTFKDWKEINPVTQQPFSAVPPVMITVANRTETAARIQYAFEHKHIITEELCDPKYLIHIDSKTLEKAEQEPIGLSGVSYHGSEEGERNLSKKVQAVVLRDTVDTIGQKGKRGEQIRNVISVGMLTEGWDAKTVTHILGLRAFTSQLLCEQVVGRGLRRTSYDINPDTQLFTPEYVNIFGIPFTFLPHEDRSGSVPAPKPKTQIEALAGKGAYQISWPNIIRIERELDPKLRIDINSLPLLTLDAADTRIRADMAPIINGKTDLRTCTNIDLEKLESCFRLQRIIFETAGRIYETMKSEWKDKASPYALMGQVFKIVENYLGAGKIRIEPPLFTMDALRVRILYMLNMHRIVEHLWDHIRYEQTEKVIPLFDPNKKARSTADMPVWFTSKPCNITEKSHISHCVYDSTWESSESYRIEKNPHVVAWAKNDHLGFGIVYVFEGIVHTYYPDFLIQLDNGKILVLETKGKDSPIAQAKRKALAGWIEAVNNLQDFGVWCSDSSFHVADVDGIIEQYLEPLETKPGFPAVPYT
ncbi:MAG: DEAD/DEAH box helicase family protein [Treponema sp.]|jgi:type III restriction enzyme|nr:DEAD/DEAH box helicase family protein [Treponema sp.]